MKVAPGTPGILALDRKRSSLFWFQGYCQQETTCWVGDYHLTGDTVQQNADGSISFVGRADDIITSSAYRIGPYEVESALIEHPAVIEAAVVGKPDPERTEVVRTLTRAAGIIVARVARGWFSRRSTKSDGTKRWASSCSAPGSRSFSSTSLVRRRKHGPFATAS
jgi:acyl-CoA synthetase (AMP-forming)/AMP-acid ligase II